MTEQSYLLAETIHAKRFPDDDAVSLSLKRMLFWCNVALFSWYSTFVLMMIRGLTQSDISLFIFFLPMWLGSLVIIGASIEMFITLCRSKHLMTHEQRVFAGSPTITSSSTFIEYESLPLLRSLYLYGVLAIIFMVLCLISQVLLYLYLIHHVISLWDALSPIIAINICFVVYLLTVKTLSPLFCVWYTYFILSMVVILLKVEHPTWYSWSDALVPLASLQIGFLGMLLYLLVSYHRYHLSLGRVLSAVGYCVALLLMLYNEYSIADNKFESKHNEIYAVWLVSISIFALSMVATMNYNVLAFADKRGYSSPQQLIKTRLGWRPLYAKEQKYWPMMGRIEVRHSFIVRNLELSDSANL